MKLILAVLCCFAVSCATVKELVNNSTLLSDATAFVVKAVLDQSKTPEERAIKADAVEKVADVILKSKFEKKPTQVEIKDLIAGALPGGWGETVAVKVAAQYEKATKGLKEDDVEAALKSLKQIAEGIKTVTD